MKNFKIIILALIAISSQAINAREIMGLNFCGFVSVADIKKSIEENNSTVSEEKTDEETGVISIDTKDYNIADTVKGITFNVYKNKLYKIVIHEVRGIGGILDAKYGVIRSESKSDNGVDRKIFYYNIKDKDVDLFSTYAEFSPGLRLNAFPWSYVTYLCKPIDRELTAEINKIKKKQQLQKNGVNKL